MDPSTASYYRAILFVDPTDERPLPPSLVKLHTWAVKRHQALGLGGVIAKAVAFTVALTWLSSTDDGGEFAAANTNLGELFGVEPAEEEADETEETVESWSTLPENTDVVVTMNNNAKKPGKFVRAQGNWGFVKVNGKERPFRLSKLEVAERV